MRSVFLIKYKGAELILLFVCSSMAMYLASILNIQKHRGLIQILSALAGVGLSIIANGLHDRKKLREHLTSLQDDLMGALKDKDFNKSIRFADLLVMFSKDFDWIEKFSDSKIAQLSLFLRHNSHIFDCIIRRDFKHAHSLIEDQEFDSINSIEENFEQDYIKNILQQYALNKNAVIGYVNGNGKPLDCSKINILSTKFHDALNSLTVSPVEVIDCFFEIVKERNSSYESFDPDKAISLIHGVLIDTLLLGAYGSLMLVRSQFPYHDKSMTKKLHRTLEKHGIKIPQIAEATIDQFCLVAMLSGQPSFGLANYVDNLVCKWEDRLGKESLPMAFLRMNVGMLTNRSSRSLSREVDLLLNASELCRQGAEIAAINVIDSLIHEGFDTSNINLLNQFSAMITHADKKQYHYDGFVLNLGVCDLILDKIDRGISRLQNLADSSKTFMVRSSAARNLMIYFARQDDKCNFETYRKLYIETYGHKDLNPDLFLIEQSKFLSFSGGGWYFVSYPSQLHYYPLQLTPWSERESI